MLEPPLRVTAVHVRALAGACVALAVLSVIFIPPGYEFTESLLAFLFLSGAVMLVAGTDGLGGAFAGAAVASLLTWPLITRAAQDPWRAEWTAVLLYALLGGGVGAVANRLRVSQAHQRRVLERLQNLQDVTSALSQALTPAEVAGVVTGRGLAMLGAGAGVLALIDREREVRVVGASGRPEDLVKRWLQAPLEASLPVADAIRLRAPVFRGPLADPPPGRPRLPGGRRAGWAGTLAAIPLLADGRVVGVIGLARAGAQRFEGDDQAFILALAQQAAQALERARLYEAERVARDRAEAGAARMRRLQLVTAALAQAATPREVAEAVLEQSAAVLGANTGSVAVLGDDGATLTIVAAFGMPDEVVAAWRRFPLDAPLPMSEATRTGQPVWLSSPDEIAARFPALAGDPSVAGVRSAAGVPLVAEGRRLGVLGLTFADARSFGDDDRDLLIALARLCAQALERARLFEAEQRAHRDEEQARLRLAFLVQASTELGGSLDFRVTLARVARLAVPALADWCVVDIVGDGVAVERLGAAHADPSKVDLLYEMTRRYPLIENPRHPTYRVLHSGEPLLVPEVTTGAIEGWAIDAGHVAAYRALGLTSRMTLPLRAGRRVIGALTLAIADSGRRYTEADLALAHDLARRAALAIEHARLYEQARSVAETLQRSLLPDRLPEIAGVEVAARYLPGGVGVEVGGDWYDAVELPDGSIGLVIGDVVGKGIPAAAVMGQLRNAARAFVLEGEPPAAVVERLNRIARQVAEPTMATLTCAVYDPRGRTLAYACAGHLPPAIVAPDGAAAFLDVAPSVPIGVMPEATYAPQEAHLAPGSTVVLYTDGLIERPGLLLEDQLLAALRDAADSGLDALLDRVIAALAPAEGRRDDVAVVALRPASLRGAPLSLRVPAVPAALRRLRLALGRWLEEQGCPAGEAFEVLVAVGEAAANATEHAYGPGDGAIDLVAAVVEDRVHVTLRDFGRWRPPRGANRGRGLQLMRALMDEVEVELAADGTIVRLQRALPRHAVT